MLIHTRRSPSYQLANKNKKLNDSKEAPLADPEPTSDISNQNATFTISSPNNGTMSGRPEPLGDFARPLPSRALHSLQSDSVSNSPITLNAPCDLPTVGSVQQLLPQNLKSLSGNPTKNRRTEQDRKIVLYILAADDGHKLEKGILQTVYRDLKDSYACRGFELQLSDVHERCDSNFLDTSCWINGGPLEAKGGHHLAATCVSEISSMTFIAVISSFYYLNRCFLFCQDIQI